MCLIIPLLKTLILFPCPIGVSVSYLIIANFQSLDLNTRFMIVKDRGELVDYQLKSKVFFKKVEGDNLREKLFLHEC